MNGISTSVTTLGTKCARNFDTEFLNGECNFDNMKDYIKKGMVLREAIGIDYRIILLQILLAARKGCGSGMIMVTPYGKL